MSRKNIQKIIPKFDFQNHFGFQNLSKIEEKSNKKRCENKTQKASKKTIWIARKKIRQVGNTLDPVTLPSLGLPPR